MGKVFMIIGKSFSGKDTLLNQILEHPFCERNNLERLVRYTTRPIRPSETEGVEYHFVSDEYYYENFKDNEECVVTSFDSEFGHLHYIIDFSKRDKDKNYILTGDPDYIIRCREILGDDFCVIWLCPPDWVLFERYNNRDDNSELTDKKYKEIQRRYVDELFTYNKANFFLENVPVMINLGKNVKKMHIILYIEKFINGYLKSVIFTNDDTVEFDNTYSSYPFLYNDPLFIINLTDDINKGIIRIHNSKIILNTREEEAIIHMTKKLNFSKLSI